MIYFFVASAEIVFLLDIYSKNQKEDLSSAEKKTLRIFIEDIKKSLR